MIKKFTTLTFTIFLVTLFYSKEMYVTGNSVNVRTENNSNSEIMSKLNLNDKVEVLEINGDWAKIEINGKNGYINQKFLSEKINEKNKNENLSFFDYLKIFGIGVLVAYAFYYSYKTKKNLL